MHPFDGLRTRIEMARQHIDSLDAAGKAWFKEHPYRIAFEKSRKPLNYAAKALVIEKYWLKCLSLKAAYRFGLTSFL